MKAKYALVALLAMTFWGCDDNTGALGLGMFPDSDKNINGRFSTFDVTTESVSSGRIYAKSKIGYVGKFTDPTFGTYNSGFLTELNCPEEMTYPEVYQAYNANNEPVDPNSSEAVRATGSMIDGGTVVNGKKVGNIYATEIYLWYSKYFGDDAAPCRLSVYKLNERIDPDKAYYTDIDPTSLYNKEDLLGQKAYTAVDYSVSEAKRNKSTYTPSVHLTLKDNTLGYELLKSARLGKLSEEFNSKIMPGLYVKSDYGDGTILYIDQVQLNTVFECYATDKKTGLKLKKKYAKDENGNAKDSTYYAYRPFSSTREMIQANQLINDDNKINELINIPTWTYLKTPAGIFTEVKLPLEDFDKIKKDVLNSVKLSFTSYNQEVDQLFGMTAPSDVLLLPKKEKDSFFEQNKINDNITSYIGSVATDKPNQYIFKNITKMITTLIDEKDAAQKELDEKKSIVVKVRNDKGTIEEKTVTTIEAWKSATDWGKLLLIPVLVTKETSKNYYQNSVQITKVQHDLRPGYVRLKGGRRGLDDEHYRLKLEVISTNRP